MALITFSAGTKAKAAQVNANFSLCLLKDAAGEITVSSALALAVGRQGATNPALQVDSSTASSATGVKVTAAAAAGGVAIAAISSGTNENLSIDAKGTGTITIGGTSTGKIMLGQIVGLGGLTASFPALKRSTTRVQIRLADDSDYAGLHSGTVLVNSGNGFVIENSNTPASAAAAGTAGTVCWDTSFVYVCTATNTWKRAAIATW